MRPSLCRGGEREGRKAPAAPGGGGVGAKSCSPPPRRGWEGCRVRHTTPAEKPASSSLGAEFALNLCARACFARPHTYIHIYIYINYIHIYIHTYTHAAPIPVAAASSPAEPLARRPARRQLIPINLSALKTQCHFRSCQSLTENLQSPETPTIIKRVVEEGVKKIIKKLKKKKIHSSF